MKLPQPDPCAAFGIWSGADATAPDPETPLYAFQYEDLLGQCQAALARREKAYPDLIKRKQMTEGDAEIDIRSWQQLAAEWTWICTGEGKLPPAGTLAARRLAVELALERIAQEFDRGNRAHDLYRQAHLNLALRWHLHRLKHGAPVIHFFAALSRTMRADAAANRSKAA